MDLCRVAAPIDLCRDAAPTDLCRVAAPIDLCRDAMPLTCTEMQPQRTTLPVCTAPLYHNPISLPIKDTIVTPKAAHPVNSHYEASRASGHSVSV